MTPSQLYKLIFLARLRFEKPRQQAFIDKLVRRNADIALSADEAMWLNKLWLDKRKQIKRYEDMRV